MLNINENDLKAAISDSYELIARREGYVEGWNDCRQDVKDVAMLIP